MSLDRRAPSPQLCTTCEEIAKVLRKWRVIPSGSRDPTDGFGDNCNVGRGPVGYLQVSQCDTCRTISQLLGNTFQYESANINFSDELDCWSISKSYSTGLPYLETSRQLHLIHIGDSPDLINATGVAVCEDRIDISRIRIWLDQCDKNHAGRCHSIADPWKRIQLGVDLILIDVQDRCLVVQKEHSEALPYAALSYSWGQGKDPFQTTLANYEQLRQTGAFDSYLHCARLPKTIAHTMQLVSALRLRYLWVDRFCIVQDDHVEKPRQLAAMAAIYANSYVTIAATEGHDDDFGLPGIGTDLAREQPFEHFRFGNDCRMMLRLPSPTFLSVKTRYHTRGWTYQEFRVSRRLLLFHHQTVSWICYEHSEQENGVPPEADVNPYLNVANLGNPHTRYVRPVPDMETFWTRVPDLQCYLRMVEQYSTRELTDPEDVLAAFSAIISIQGRAMIGGIFYGIPELFFHTALLWKPKKWNLPRRLNRDGELSTRFPSWSWAAWNGQIDMEFVLQMSGLAKTGLHASSPPAFIPVAKFYKTRPSNAPGCEERIKDVHYFQPGRTMQRLREGVYVSSEELLHAVPKVDNPNTVTLHTDSLYSSNIDFRAPRLFLMVEAVPCSPKDRIFTDEIYITDSTGRVVGNLDIGRMPIGERLPGMPAEMAEFVAIGSTVMHEPQAFAFSRHLDWNCASLCRSRGVECDWEVRHTLKVYNVLWIEWKHGVAYRRTVGKVWQEYWDKSNPEEVDVRLG